MRDMHAFCRIGQKSALATVTFLLLLAVFTTACGATPPAQKPTNTPMPTAFAAATLTPMGANIPTFTPIPVGSSSPTRPLALGPTRTPTRPPAPSDTPTPAPVTSTDWYASGMRERQNGYYDRAIAAFQTALGMKPNADLARDAQFRIAETYMLAGDDDLAIPALNTYLQAYPDGVQAPEAHYWLANAFLKKNDYANAIAQLQIYRGQTQTLAGDTDAEIADALSRTGNSDGALSYYDRALQDSTLAAPTRVNIMMREATARLLRGEGSPAGAQFDAALALATDAKTRATINWNAGQAYAAANRMDLAQARWTSAITDTPEQPGAQQALTELTNRKLPVDDIQRGLVEYYGGNYDAAAAALQRAVQNAGPRANIARYWLARSFAAQDSIPQALAQYDAIINSQSKDAVVSDAYMGKASILESSGNVDQAAQVYRRLPIVIPDSPRAAEAMLDAGLALEGAKRYRDAVSVFDQVQSTFSTRDTDRAAEALFHAGLGYYLFQDSQTASARWQSVVDRYPQSDFYTAALYWLGKVNAARGQKDAAARYWTQAAAVTRQVFKSFRRNYYAYRAQSALNPPRANAGTSLYDISRYSMGEDRKELETWIAEWAKTGTATPGVLDSAIRADLNFRRGDELLRLGRLDEAHLEFSALVDRWEENPWALYALALYFQDQGQYDFTIASAIRLYNLGLESSARPQPRGLDLLRYPTYYADLVVSESKANGLDPRLYFAFIRLESRFNPRNTGPVGERGLTQIGPHVLPSIVQALKIPDVSPDQLYLPYMSLRLGAWLFAQNAKQLDDPIYAFAAYNAGLGRAMGWRSDDVDLALEQFDIDDARTYVFIVYPYWQEYMRLY